MENREPIFEPNNPEELSHKEFLEDASVAYQEVELEREKLIREKLERYEKETGRTVDRKTGTDIEAMKAYLYKIYELEAKENQGEVLVPEPIKEITPNARIRAYEAWKRDEEHKHPSISTRIIKMFKR